MEIKINSLCPHSLGGGVSVPDNELDAWGLYFAAITKPIMTASSDIVACIIKKNTVDQLISRNIDSIYYDRQFAFMCVSSQTSDTAFDVLNCNTPHVYWFSYGLNIHELSQNNTSSITKITDENHLRKCSLLFISTNLFIKQAIDNGYIDPNYIIPIQYSDLFRFHDFLKEHENDITIINLN